MPRDDLEIQEMVDGWLHPGKPALENLQRDLAKEIDVLRTTRPARKSRRWTLLLMRDHGRVIRVGWLKWVALLSALLLIAAAAGASYFFVLYRRSRDANAGLNRVWADVRQELGELRNEKDILTARLAVAEVEMERLKAEAAAQPVDRSEPQKGVERPLEITARGAAGESRSESEAGGNAETKASGRAPAAAATQTAAAVAIEKLAISYEAVEKTFRVQFLLKNNGPETDPVAGYTAVVLRDPDAASDTRLALPPVKLDGAGVPTGPKRGQYFAIARFKTVNSAAPGNFDPGRFFLNENFFHGRWYGWR